MTRLFTDGAEDPSGIALWTGISSAARVSTPVRSGLYSYRCVYDGSMYKTFTATNEAYFRIGWRISGNYNTHKTVRFRSGSTELITLGLSTVNRNFQILVGGSVVATGTFVYNINAFYNLEFHIKIADSGGVVQLKVDGTLDIDYTGDTQPAALTTIDNLLVASNYNLSTGEAYTYFDDVAINNTAGAADNSWCGDGRVIYFPAESAGDVTQLTPNTGENWAAVDETAQDGDSTYVEGDTVGEYDLYNLAASGLPTGSTINRVIPVASAKDTVANGGKIALMLKTNNTEYSSSDIPLTTDYTPVRGTEYLVNPNTSAAFTVAEIDALQVGVKARGT